MANTDTNQVLLPYEYYPDPTKGRPVFNGQIFVGNPDTDPEIASNRKSIRAIQESGASVPVSQPVRTSAGGVPVINGSPVQLVVDGEYSIKVLNAQGAQVYYAPSLVGGRAPTFVSRTQVVPLSVDLTDRFVNNTLFQTNISWADFYAVQTPVPNRTIDLGPIGSEPFEIENIPTNRFDFAQNTSTTDLGSVA